MSALDTSASAAQEPIQRTTARVLPVSEDGQVLLLQCQDPARPGEPHWVSIGGAVDPGESLLEAAVREMWEEIGVETAPEALVGPIRTGTHPFSWDGVDYVSRSHFFALSLPGSTATSFAGLEPAEIGNVLQADWWTPEALAGDGTAASPDLPEIMAAAIAVVRGEP